MFLDDLLRLGQDGSGEEVPDRAGYVGFGFLGLVLAQQLNGCRIDAWVVVAQIGVGGVCLTLQSSLDRGISHTHQGALRC